MHFGLLPLRFRPFIPSMGRQLIKSKTEEGKLLLTFHELHRHRVCPTIPFLQRSSLFTPAVRLRYDQSRDVYIRRDVYSFTTSRSH